jgi:hypothetical protein
LFTGAQAALKAVVLARRFNLLLQLVYEEFTLDTEKDKFFQLLDKNASFLTKERQSEDCSARDAVPRSLVHRVLHTFRGYPRTRFPPLAIAADLPPSCVDATGFLAHVLSVHEH